MKFHRLEDYEKMRPLLDADYWNTLRYRHMLFHSPHEEHIFWVDDVDKPSIIFPCWKEETSSIDGIYCADPAIYPRILETEPIASAKLISALPEVACAYLRKKSRIKKEYPSYRYALKDRSRFKGKASPEVGYLKPQHAKLVADSWPYGGDWSVDYIRAIIEDFPTAAYYREEIPVAFCALHGDGSMGFLYVEPKLRGKGLGRLVSDTFIHRLLEENFPIFCHIIRDNVASIKLTERLGLEQICELSWMDLVTEEKEGEEEGE